MGFSRVDARRLRPRPPLVVTDASGRRQPVGWLALGPDALWTVPFQRQRLWRVPLEGGPARPVLGVGGFLYELAADAGRVWMLSGSGDPTASATRPSGCGVWTAPRPGHRHHATAAAGGWRIQGPARARPWRWRGLGWPVRTLAGCTVAASCCGWIPPLGGWRGGFATRSGSSRVCWPPGRMGCGWGPRRPRSCTWSRPSPRVERTACLPGHHTWQLG